MTLKEDMVEDLDMFFNLDEFAETITYNGVEIPAVVDFGEHPYEHGDALRDRAVIYVKVSDVAAPDYQDAVTIRGDAWTVRKVPDGHDGATWLIEVARNIRPTLKG